MAEISGLTGLGAAPASDDQFVILDVSDTTQSANGTTKKLAASRVARTGAANTFSAAQTIDTTDTAVLVLSRSTAIRQRTQLSDISTSFDLVAADFGANGGPQLNIQRNTNASTPAAANMRLENNAGTGYRIWPDASGNLRIGTSVPTNANDTSGTVVGTQTSWHELKENIEEWDGADALDAIRALTLYSYQFIADGQKTPAGDKPTYFGLVITDEDREANAWFGLGYAENQIPVLNDRNLFGYMLAAIRHGGNIINALQDQVAALQARVEALEGG